MSGYFEGRMHQIPCEETFFMARYEYDCWVNTPMEKLPSLISQLLQGCELEVIYQGTDYVKARDFPGKVSLSSFITVDVLIESSIQKQG